MKQAPLSLIQLLNHETGKFITDITKHPRLGRLADGTTSVENYIYCLHRLYSLDSAVNRLPKIAEQQLKHDALAGVLRSRFHASAIEEENHEHFIARDLAFLGSTAERDISCETYITELIDNSPERWLGMGYLLETASARLFPLVHKNIVATNIIPTQALSWLRLHAEVDQEHAQYWEETVIGVDGLIGEDEKRLIAKAANDIAHYVLSRY